MSGITHSATKYHVSGDLNPKHHHYDELVYLSHLVPQLDSG